MERGGGGIEVKVRLSWNVFPSTRMVKWSPAYSSLVTDLMPPSGGSRPGFGVVCRWSLRRTARIDDASSAKCLRMRYPVDTCYHMRWG